MTNDELLEILKRLFNSKLSNSEEYLRLIEKIQLSNGNYEDAENLAYEVGEALARAFEEGITPDVLVDGFLTQEVSYGALKPMFINGYDITTDASRIVQQTINDDARIGMSPVLAPLNEDRVNGILDKASSDLYENTKWVLDEPVKNYMQSVPVEHLERNSKAQWRSGLEPKIVRKVVGNCCDWCASLAGTYNYPNVPSEIYKRHRNCRCTVDYYPTGRGKSQDVWSKGWKENNKVDKIVLPNSKEVKDEIINVLNLPKTAVVNIPPVQIDLARYDFDDEHINLARKHNVTKEEAIGFINNASCSISKWDGQYENYYGVTGCAYVDVENKNIRTAFGYDKFDKRLKDLIEVFKKYGRYL